MKYLTFLLVFPTFLLSCKKERDLSVNALAISTVSNLLVDRQTHWWHNNVSDTLLLNSNIQYGASVVFYHIDGSDTINVSDQVLDDANKALLFWETSDPGGTVDFKGGFEASQGTQAFLQSAEAGGPHTLGLKLLYQADPNVQSGDVVLTAFLPVVVR